MIQRNWLFLLNILIALLFLGCYGIKQSLNTDDANGFREKQMSCYLKILPTYSLYPHHLAYEITSVSKSCQICKKGMRNNFEMTILNAENLVVLANEQGDCLSHPSTLEPGSKYTFPVLPQEYLKKSSALSGYYMLYGAYTDFDGTKMLSDTVLFFYNSTLDYKYRYRRDWSMDIDTKIEVTQYNRLSVHLTNRSDDTLNLSETLILVAAPKSSNSNLNKDLVNDITQLYAGKYLFPHSSDTTYISCEYLEGIMGASEYYTVKLSFIPDPFVPSPVSIVYCN
jgi:hypothetical protein